MTWENRLQEAAYTSPGGTRTVLTYEDVRYTQEKKTTAFEFPDVDGTYVQDNGNTGRRYPMRVFFWGADYDQAADAFAETLLERGTGVLEHPIYGTVDVVPFGGIGRRDDLKTAAGQAVFELTFWATTGLVFPTVQVDPAAAVGAAVGEFNDAAAAAFEGGVSLDGAVEQTTFASSYNNLLDAAKGGLEAIASTSAEVQAQFDAVSDSINRGIDILIGQPLTLAFQTSILLQAPARAAAAIEARLDAYGNLADQITGQGPVQPIQGPAAATDTERPNEFQTQDLYASTYVTGSILSTINATFETRGDAIAAAEVLLNQIDAVTDWRDESFRALGLVDTGSAYQKLQEAAAIAAGFLIEISFDLRQERTLVLERDRTIIDLCAELYGEVDEKLDFLINTNNLSGSEILEVPKGRRIVYYA